MSWNILTDRQKSLDRAIEQCGVKLDNSDACFRRVMNAIGASASESSFVRQRIELRLRTAALLNQTDDFISNTEKMLGISLKRMMRSGSRKGRKLGLISEDRNPSVLLSI